MGPMQPCNGSLNRQALREASKKSKQGEAPWWKYSLGTLPGLVGAPGEGGAGTRMKASGLDKVSMWEGMKERNAALMGEKAAAPPVSFHGGNCIAGSRKCCRKCGVWPQRSRVGGPEGLPTAPAAAGGSLITGA